MLINATLEYPDGLKHTRPGCANMMDMLRKSREAAIYSSTRTKIDRMNIHQVAERMKKAGIRGLLESAGYFDILPPNENGVLLIQVPGLNLPKVGDKWFPMRLEIAKT
ncbi:hypothetical protein ANO14919_134090 [Xylariales sp. No.14919]|nr:hypothetical protein ANO14919_134090 [Xylariales sp. No.14919]